MKPEMLILLAIFAAIPSPLPAAPPTDLEIVSIVHDSYTFRTLLQDRVKATSDHGKVVLTGIVMDEDDRDLAADTTISVRGVVRIDNRTVIQAPVGTGKDAWIFRRITQRLQTRAGVSPVGITITVTDSIVTLTGTSPDYAQSRRTEYLAREIGGVRGVRNELFVTEERLPPMPGTAGMDDASITAQVNQALRTDGVVSELRAQGIVRDGVVTLMGGPGTSTQKSHAIRLVEEIRGVKSVVNRILLI